MKDPNEEPEAQAMDLPPSWTSSAFHVVGEIVCDGVDPRQVPSAMHIAPDNIESSTGRLLKCRMVEEDKVISNNFQFTAGDVLYTKLRPYLNKVVVAPFDGVCSSDILPIRARIEPRFLAYWMLSPGFVHQVIPKQTGVTLPRISRKELSNLPVPIPPLPEQRRIVEAIEANFARLDEAVAELERARASLKRYRASVLSGYFPEEDSDRAGADYTELSSVCGTATGGTPRRQNPEYYDGHIPWVKSGELNDGLVTTVEEKISQAAIDESNAKVFPSGTVCMALYGATVGRLGVLGLDAATNQAVCAFFPDGQLTRPYLFWFLRSVRSRLLSQRSGGAQPNISQTIVRALRLPLLPLKEQDQVVGEIEQHMSITGEVTSEVEHGLARGAYMRKSILQAAFAGRLVPQDPYDEPASALLERIKHERSSSSQSMAQKRKAVRAS